MAYDLKNATNNILKYKSDYDRAAEAGDKKKMEEARKAASQYYASLRNNGYGTVANNLSQRGYNDALKYVDDYYTKTGRVTPREYFVQKGKAFNMTPEQVNSLISYDTTTGEVGFAGKNIGKPDGIADNRSYFKADYLDNVWDNYIKDSGISRTPEQLAGINSEEAREKMNNLFETAGKDRDYLVEQNDEFMDYNYNHDPYKSDIGKSIMDRFNYLGGVASGDAAATGAAANSGNIDSFAAANAARQQLAFTTAGTQAVLADFNSRIANAKEKLSDLGVQLKDVRADMKDVIGYQQNEAQRNEDNSEQRKLNAQNIENDRTENLAIQSDYTGYIPVEWQQKNNQYFKNGTLVNPDTDYMAIINHAAEQLKRTDLSSTERANWEKTLKDATQARNYKTSQLGYSNYGQITPSVAPEENAAMRESGAQRDFEASENAKDREQATKALQMETDAAITQKEIDAKNTIDQIEKNTESAKELADYYVSLGLNPDGTQKTTTGQSNALNGTGTGNNESDKNDWTADGNGSDVSESDSVNVISIGAIDEDRLKSCNVDKYGRAMIEALQKEAAAKGGILTEDELLSFVKNNSDAYNTNLNQIKKVYRYLGADQSKLDNLKDAGFWFWQWGDGVEESK